MSDRLFLLDKNYILKQAQQDLRLELQATLVDKIKQGYYTHYNSLRLSDDTTERIEAFQPAHLSPFDDLYDVLCGFFRYKAGDNQLEILFDGRSHYEMYLADWKAAFLADIDQLCTRQNFIIAGLELSVYYNPEKRSDLAQNRMRLCIFNHFGLKLYKYKGIQKFEVKTA